jgi:hypothetical protein
MKFDDFAAAHLPQQPGLKRYWRVDEVSKTFAKFENNFTMQEIPRGRSILTSA